jgi:transcriptional regulator with XRE-family HTH domain
MPPQDDNEDIGARLLTWRTEKRIDQKQVAKALGVTQQTISNWEGGKPPRGGRLSQLRAYLAGYHEHAADVPPVEVKRPMFFGLDKARTELQELEQEFFDALPEQLRGHSRVTIPFAGFHWRPDYLSPKVCAEIKVLHVGRLESSISYSIEHALFCLSTVRAIHTQQQTLREAYALLLIGPHPSGRWGHARLQSAAAAHGITIYTLPDPIAAAALVADLEYGPIE